MLIAFTNKNDPQESSITIFTVLKGANATVRGVKSYLSERFYNDWFVTKSHFVTLNVTCYSEQSYQTVLEQRESCDFDVERNKDDYFNKFLDVDIEHEYKKKKEIL